MTSRSDSEFLGLLRIAKLDSEIDVKESHLLTRLPQYRRFLESGRFVDTELNERVAASIIRMDYLNKLRYRLVELLTTNSSKLGDFDSAKSFLFRELITVNKALVEDLKWIVDELESRVLRR